MVVCIFSVLFYLISIFHFYFWKIIPPNNMRLSSVWKTERKIWNYWHLLFTSSRTPSVMGPEKEASWHSPFTKSCHETMCKQSSDLVGFNYCMLQCKIILIWNNLSECRGSNKCQIYETSYLPFDPSWCLCLFCCNEYRQHVCLPLELNICVTESYCTLVKIYKKLSKNKTIFLW